MKKVTDFDPFKQEESFIHKLSEGNSAYIAYSSPYIDLPSFPVGKEKAMYKVGQKVVDSGRSFYKTPMVWKVIEVYKQGGYMRYVCQLVVTAKLKKEGWLATKTTFHQSDLERVVK